MGEFESYSGIIMFAVVIVVYYFLLIRPQKKKNKEIKELRDSISVGDKIITIGGIMGKVVSTKEDEVVIESGIDRTKLQIARWGISNRIDSE